MGGSTLRYQHTRQREVLIKHPSGEVPFKPTYPIKYSTLGKEIQWMSMFKWMFMSMFMLIACFSLLAPREVRQPGLDERDEGNPVATMRAGTYAMHYSLPGTKVPTSNGWKEGMTMLTYALIPHLSIICHTHRAFQGGPFREGR
jgi:hypothetical protein